MRNRKTTPLYERLSRNVFHARKKAQRSILHAFTFEKLCDSHTLWMFRIQT
jgi:hypothetical protein